MKRMCSVLLALAMLSGMLAVLPAAAQTTGTTVTFTVQTVETEAVAAGEQVTLAITASAADSIAAIDLRVTYDQAVLKPVECTAQGYMAKFSMVEANLEPVYVKNTEGLGEIAVSAMTTSAVAGTEGETIVSVTFEALTAITADTVVGIVAPAASNGDMVPHDTAAVNGGIAVKEVLNGIVLGEDSYYYYYIDGVMQKNIGMIEVDGAYYFVCYSGRLKMNGPQTVTEEKANGLIAAGTYYFGADCKMVVESKEGIVLGEDGYYYYYIDGVMQKNIGLIEVDGFYYFVCYSGRLKMNGPQTLTEDTANGLIAVGTYYFGADCKMVIESTDETKNGIVDGYYYENGAVKGDVGVIEVDGAYYFVCYSGKIKTNGYQTVTEEKANGLIAAGTYYFGEDGKMVVELKEGIVLGEDGYYYYYIDGVMQKNIGLIEVDGFYYFVCYSGRLKMNGPQTLTEDTANGLIAVGTYYFGADCKMVIESTDETKNGIVDGYYYENGAVKGDVGVIEVDGAYYFVCYSGKIKTNGNQTVTEEKANGLIAAGTYYFGEDGKMVITEE